MCSSHESIPLLNWTAGNDTATRASCGDNWEVSRGVSATFLGANDVPVGMLDRTKKAKAVAAKRPRRIVTASFMALPMARRVKGPMV